jgi:SAM-dependent methyltransferase
LKSSILRNREIAGRTFHKLRAEESPYWGPNDEQQNDTLDICYHMIQLLQDNRLNYAPIDSSVKKVLDLGTGTGIWAIDFADQHPDAEVTGLDLSPIQPSWVPPNCKFVIDDMTIPASLGAENSVDFMHLRVISGCVGDWPAFYESIYKAMKPGGWIQQTEISIMCESDDGTVKEGHVMREWSHKLLELGEQRGRTFNVADRIVGWIKGAGFEAMEHKVFKAPIGKWPKDPKLKEVGLCNYFFCYEACEGWALLLLTHVAGWSLEESQAYIAQFRKALNDQGNHAYYRM